jgi:hypothetical protein
MRMRPPVRESESGVMNHGRPQADDLPWSERLMRVLWIGSPSTSGNAGNEVFDARMIQALRAGGVEVRHVAPRPTRRVAQFSNYLRGIPHYRAAFESEDNHHRISDAAHGCDAAICSREFFDGLAAGLHLPVIPVLHNITSCSLRAIFPRNLVARPFVWTAARWERSLYTQHWPFIAVAVLSRRDEAFVRRLRSRSVLYTPPGMPSPLKLSSNAAFRPEMVLSGTYDWFPKRRDLAAFSRELASVQMPIKVAVDGALPKLKPPIESAPMVADADAIRIGLVLDRFESGFKLKAQYYLSQNCIVLSYSDLSADFAQIPDAAFFVRRITHARDVAVVAAELAAIPASLLRRRMSAFSAACAAAFSWAKSAQVLLDGFQSHGN